MSSDEFYERLRIEFGLVKFADAQGRRVLMSANETHFIIPDPAAMSSDDMRSAQYDFITSRLGDYALGY